MNNDIPILLINVIKLMNEQNDFGFKIILKNSQLQRTEPYNGSKCGQLYVELKIYLNDIFFKNCIFYYYIAEDIIVYGNHLINEFFYKILKSEHKYLSLTNSELIW